MNKWAVLLLELLAGFIAFLLIRVTTKKLGNWFEKFNPASNLLFSWIFEIGSDVKNLGKGLSYYIALSLPIFLQWNQTVLILLKGLQTYFVVLIGVLIVTFLNVWEQWRITNISKSISSKDRQFALTLFPLIANGGKYVVYFLGILSIFSVWGFDILPVLGGLGIVGLIIGVGANSLVNDLISGIFIIFERLYFVDSVIEVISGEKVIASGTVSRITWRITYIKEIQSGYTIAIANRNLSVIRIIKK